MLTLHARDGARFSGTIQMIGSQVRASYIVTLDLGARAEKQHDASVFPSEEQAIGWFQSEATARGFEYFSLEWRSALPGSNPAKQRDRGTGEYALTPFAEIGN